MVPTTIAATGRATVPASPATMAPTTTEAIAALKPALARSIFSASPDLVGHEPAEIDAVQFPFPFSIQDNVVHHPVLGCELARRVIEPPRRRTAQPDWLASVVRRNAAVLPGAEPPAARRGKPRIGWLMLGAGWWLMGVVDCGGGIPVRRFVGAVLAGFGVFGAFGAFVAFGALAL